jgi:DNA-binding MarR family transcriptional regulator
MKVIERHNGASLSLVSERLGSTLSAASKVVDSLVEQGYVCRETDEDDRRRLILEVTDPGKLALERVHQQVLSCLAEKLAPLSLGERAMVRLAMDLLRSTITSTQLEPSVSITPEK